MPSAFSALSLKQDATRHNLFITTHNIHTPSPGRQPQHPHFGAKAATLHHSHTTDPEYDTWRFQGSMPAIQRYKIHLQRAIIHKVTGLNWVGCRPPKFPMADPSTTTALILHLIAGDCCVRPQLHSDIKVTSVASELMKSLTIIAVVFIGPLALPKLDVRSLHDHWADPESDCRRLFGSALATQRYKVGPSTICKTKRKLLSLYNL